MTIDDLYNERARLLDAEDAGTATPSQRKRLAEVLHRIDQINRERAAEMRQQDRDLAKLRAIEERIAEAKRSHMRGRP